MQKPRISIIMLNYNYERYIKKAIDSIVNQTISPYEFLIIDDCSTDKSSAIIKEYEKNYSFIKYYQNKKNVGIYYNINRALKISNGDYVFFFASDDYVAPTLIEQSTQLLRQYPEIGLVCSKPVFVNKNDKFLSELNISFSNIINSIQKKNLVNLFKQNFFIAGHTAIIKKKYLEETSGYPESLKWHCDWFSTNIIALRYGICYINRRLAFLRFHGKSNSSNIKWKSQKHIIKNLFSLIGNEKYKDISKVFFQSHIIFQIPFIYLYILIHPIKVFSFDHNILKGFFIKILEIKNFIKFIKFLLRPFLGYSYKYLKIKLLKKPEKL